MTLKDKEEIHRMAIISGYGLMRITKGKMWIETTKDHVTMCGRKGNLKFFEELMNLHPDKLKETNAEKINEAFRHFKIGVVATQKGKNINTNGDADGMERLNDFLKYCIGYEMSEIDKLTTA